MSELEHAARPPEGSLDRWAYDYVTSTELTHKLAPPALPAEWAATSAPLRIERPGRPVELTVTWQEVQGAKVCGGTP